MMPVCPVATNRVRTRASLSSRVSWSCAVIFPTLQSVPTVRTTSGSTALAGPEATGRSAGGRRRSQISRPLASRLCREHRIVAQKGVQPAPESQPASSASASQARQSSGSCPPFGAIPISTASGSERQPLAHRSHHRNPAAESQHVLRGLARLRAVEDPDGALGQVADDGVGGLRGHRAEVAIGQNQKARRSHRTVLQSLQWYTVLYSNFGRRFKARRTV